MKTRQQKQWGIAASSRIPSAALPWLLSSSSSSSFLGEFWTDTTQQLLTLTNQSIHPSVNQHLSMNLYFESGIQRRPCWNADRNLQPSSWEKITSLCHQRHFSSFSMFGILQQVVNRGLLCRLLVILWISRMKQVMGRIRGLWRDLTVQVYVPKTGSLQWAGLFCWTC